MDSEEEEKLHEYFTNRPIGFIIFFTLSMIVSVFGIFGNFMIIYTKLRRFSQLNGLELFIVNLAFAFISLCAICFTLLTDEMFHELADNGFCKTNWFLQGFSQTSIAFSSVALIITSKYFSKISRQHASIIIGITWIIALLDAYPFFNLIIYPLRMRNGMTRNVCHLEFEDLHEISFYKMRQKFVFTVEFVFPTLMLIITSCAAFLWKKPDASTNKIIFNYSIACMTFFMLINSFLVINRFTSSTGTPILSNDFRHVFRFFLTFTVLANSLIYGYFDKFYVKEVLQSVCIENSSDSVLYQQHDDKEVEEV